MSEHGVYAIARSLWDDDDFADEPYTEKQAMAWLIGAAAWKAKKVRINNVPVQLERGDFCFAVRFLAEKWQWSKSRVHRFLDRCTERGILRSAIRDGAKVYSLINYNKFQVVGLPKGDEERDKSGTSPGQVRDKEETGKQVNIESIGQSKKANGHHPPAEPDRFTEFWAIYPRKVAKRGAEKAYRLALARASPDTILAGAKRYAAATRGKEKDYIAHATTWLNQDRWTDEDASSPPQEDDDWRKLRLL